MKRNTCLIAIDMQKDFMDIPGAALPVPGAVADAERLVKFIDEFNPTRILSSLDTHSRLSIHLTAWWRNKDGSEIDPMLFTQVTEEDLMEGKYVARIDPHYSLNYIKALKANGEFPHTLWPDHCIQGTEGHALLPIYADALGRWESKNLRWVNFITKGVNPFTEHFGIFRANVPVPQDAANTDKNQTTFDTLSTFDKVFIAGQARTHCVANSLRQIIQIAPQLAGKLVVLTDAMSNVAGIPDPAFYDMVDNLYKDAEAMGVTMAKTTDFI